MRRVSLCYGIISCSSSLSRPLLITCCQWCEIAKYWIIMSYWSLFSSHHTTIGKHYSQQYLPTSRCLLTSDSRVRSTGRSSSADKPSLAKMCSISIHPPQTASFPLDLTSAMATPGWSNWERNVGNFPNHTSDLLDFGFLHVDRS